MSSVDGVPSGIQFEHDIQIPLRDGASVCADVFRPDKPGHYPVVVAQGPYGKDPWIGAAYAAEWADFVERYPEVVKDGSSGRLIAWEFVDPERWVPRGYVVVTVDVRGQGKSPGYYDPYSPRETNDYFDVIEWAGTQEWSSGRVGLIGVSYMAANQWQVAALRPPHLTAMIPWEGSCDLYRDTSHPGGILSNRYPATWWINQIMVNQHGNGDTPYHDRFSDEPTTGPPLSQAQLDLNRAPIASSALFRPLDGPYYWERTPDLDRIQVPLLSAANWGGAGLHLRGNIEGFVQAGSRQKWLFTHSGVHFHDFYLSHGVELQQRFFDHFLRDIDNGWDAEPPVQLLIRRPESSERRAEEAWPIPRTVWTAAALTADCGLDLEPGSADAQPGSVSFDALTESLTFLTSPLGSDIEITGPVALVLWVSSTTTDADLFVALRAFDGDRVEMTFEGAHHVHVPIGLGWLRASHRKLDEERSLPYRPFHTHDERQPLVPGKVYRLDIEIQPTSFVAPEGYRLALTVGGTDYRPPGANGPGPLDHDDPTDRPASVYGGRTTLHLGGEYPSNILLPVIPERS